MAKSREAGINAACEYTGLSEECADYLHERKNIDYHADLTDPAILSAILDHAGACEMLDCIRYAVTLKAQSCGNMAQDIGAYLAAKEAGFVPLLVDESEAFYEMRAAELFRQIAREIITEKAASTTARYSNLLDMREAIVSFNAPGAEGRGE